MNSHLATHRLGWRLLLVTAAAALLAPATWAQVPVDESGNPIQPINESAGARVEAVPAEDLMTAEELQTLVGPIALYPDDLLAIVLPASTYPLEIVQAARFLEDHEEDESLEPDASWDDSVVALLNYPEVLRMMNDDIDWTWRLGTAVANQQPEVIAAVEAFRDRAYAAGNLKTDEYQTVSENDEGVIEIEPVNEEIIYVPYYEPERVVVYQPRPVYYYYPRPYPVYYYPYPHGYNFYANYFWGVTTAFTIGWSTDHLHVFHHSYWGHPYYGRTYYPYWWYRRPSITVYNTWYGDRRSERTRDHYANGDFWRPRHGGGARPGFNRSRADYYRDRQRSVTSAGYRDGDRSRPAATGTGRRATPVARSNDSRNNDRRSGANGRPGVRGEADARTSLRDRSSGDAAIRFRERDRSSGDAAVRFRERDRSSGDAAIRFRERDRSSGDAAIRFREREGRPVSPSTTRERAAGTTDRRATDERRPAISERSERPAQRSIRRGETRTEVRRESAGPSPRASQPARVTAPRSPSRPSSSTPRSVSRPVTNSAPRSVSRPVTNSAPRSVSRPAASAPRSAAPSSSSRSGSNSTRRAEAPSSGDRRVRHR